MNIERMKQQMERMERGMRLAAYSMKKGQRAFERAFYTPGDRHMDNVCKSILRGDPGRDPEIRLHAAAAFAEVLDGTWRR